MDCFQTKANLIFSNQMALSRCGESQTLHWWRKKIWPTVKHGGGGVMMWGCMSSAGVGELVFIEGVMDKAYYLSILKENLKKKCLKS